MEYTEATRSPKGGHRVGFQEEAAWLRRGGGQCQLPTAGRALRGEEGAPGHKSGASSSFQKGPRGSSEFQLQKMSNADQ